jgi:hypothetical protein
MRRRTLAERSDGGAGIRARFAISPCFATVGAEAPYPRRHEDWWDAILGHHHHMFARRGDVHRFRTETRALVDICERSKALIHVWSESILEERILSASMVFRSKTKNRKRRKPNAVRQRPSQEARADSYQEPHGDSPPPPPAIPKDRQRSDWHLSKGWKEFWAFAGPLLAIVGAWNYWVPNISIAPGVNLDPRQEFQTQFVISNTGHIPIYDVHFSCDLIGNRLAVAELGTGDMLEPIPQLLGTASRGCFAKSLVAHGPWLKVTARYRWPLTGKEHSSSGFFSVREGANGVFLVSEPPPSPEPRSILHVNGP